MSENVLYTGDNLYILNGMDSETVDLIYLDPPFNSKRLYKAPVGSKAAGTSFKDMWTWKDVDESYLDKLVEDYPYLVQFIQSVEAIHSKPMMAYITYMTQRLIEARRVLKPSGSVYLHCDPTASHYLKIVMDRIFGKTFFRNEVIWLYEGREVRKTSYNAKHDVLLFFSKSRNFTFNWKTISSPLKESSRKALSRFLDEDGKAYLLRYKKGGGFAPQSMEGNPEVYRQYVPEGTPPRDWVKIDVARKKERTGYPTQKPLALLKRIIKVSSNPGDLVLDPFCGCATTCVAAQQLQRRWIGIDISEKAAELVAERLSDDAGLFTDFVHLDRPPARTDLERREPDQETKRALFVDQKGRCNACGVELGIRHLEIDHIIPRSKNGGDHYENYQLLCGHCNRIKGDRPMEYLRAKIKRRNETLKLRVSF